MLLRFGASKKNVRFNHSKRTLAADLRRRQDPATIGCMMSGRWVPLGVYKAVAAILLSSIASCMGPSLSPATGHLAPWTTQLREQQPEDAFAAVYKVGKQHLVFVGSIHENNVDSPTFRMIGDAYAGFDMDVVVIEGYPTSRGANPPRLMEYAAEEQRDGFQEGGESVPTIVGAIKEGAEIWGGEPEDADLKNRVLGQGFSAEDMLGYYVLRVVPQWIRERKIESAADARLEPLVEEELRRQRGFLRLEDAILPNFDSWASWYQGLNAKPINSSFTTEEAGPLQDGKFSTNKIAAAVSRARDTYLHELIIKHLKAGKSVMAVFGGSHLMIQRPAFDAALGAPCYAGSNLQHTPSRCRSPR